jgi:sporulation protein YlmC with PRC-barrel domain
MTATQATTDTVPLPGTGGIDPNRLSNMIEFEVVAQNGDEIGDVNDMVLNLREAQVVYVVVDIGGFLGIGQRQVAVPWDQLTVKSGADESTGAEGQNVFVLNIDQAMLENAPELDMDAIPGVDEPVEGWDEVINGFWATGGMTDTTITQTPGAAGSDVATTTPAAGTTITGTAQAPVDMDDDRLPQIILASELLDREIVWRANNLEGTGTITTTQGTDSAAMDAQLTVRDAIINTGDGSIEYLIVVVSGLLEDDTWVPIPPNLLFEDDGDG